jgi:hypothetical protein
MVTGELKSLRITLEAVAGSVLGYVYLREVQPGESKHQVSVEPHSVVADYDAEGRLLGVEFLDAERAEPALMRRLAEELSAPDLAAIDLAAMCKAVT